MRCPNCGVPEGQYHTDECYYKVTCGHVFFNKEAVLMEAEVKREELVMPKQQHNELIYESYTCASCGQGSTSPAYAIHEHDCDGEMYPGKLFKKKPEETKYDPVNRPKHYNPDSPYETIKIIEHMGWAEHYCRGNALKYLMRAGKKEGEPELRDLKKAAWYINRLVSILEKKE